MRSTVLSLLLLAFSTLAIASTAEEYTLQILEPTGGKLARPSSWFYEERHRTVDSLLWTISKEEPLNGYYDTGLAIQFMIGIHDKTGMTPEQFIHKNLKTIASLAKNTTLCDSEAVGFFTRQCLEVEEVQSRDGKEVNYHVLYSFFWNNEADMAAITVAGAPSASWEKYKNIFNKMAEIELIDFERFKNNDGL